MAKAEKKTKKFEKKQLKKQKAKKRNKTTRKFGLLLMGAYVPAFINIHFRYAKHNFKVWAALFIAPFLVAKLVLMRINDMLPEHEQIVWHYDLLAIFAISICFYAAERFDNFRRVYVWAVPVTIFCGLLYWSNGQGSNEMSGSIVKLLLIAYLSYRVGKFTISDGYVELDDGADTDYHTGKELYDVAAYGAAMPLLEASARRGHFKSLYLLGDIYENGHHTPKDIVKAAVFYHKAGQKGYVPAAKRCEAVLETLTPQQSLSFEKYIREKLFQEE